MTDTLSLADDGPEGERRSPVSLRVVYSPDEAAVGKTVEFAGAKTVLIGREVSSGLQINDARVSKLHARLIATEDHLSFADAGSSNGTFLNGAIEARGRLHHSDVLRVGDTILVLEPRELRSETLSARVDEAALSDLSVLVLGETGTGKELLARRIHEASGRTGAFVPLNCATLPKDLVTAELFGHAKGAFSGADTARPGLFRAADSGTLFLDEIGDLPVETQPALLRALEERKVRPVGTDHEIAVDVRVVAATHVDLDGAVAERRFRTDLLGRLAHVVLRVPPLRARRWEILSLAREFGPSLRLSPNAAEGLLLWQFPRNVRELRAIIESVALFVKEEPVVHLSDISERIPDAARIVQARKKASASPPRPTGKPLPAKRRDEVERLLAEHQGNVTAVARELGKPRAQVYRWLLSLGIDVESFRPKA